MLPKTIKKYKAEEFLPYSAIDLAYYMINKSIELGFKVSPNLTIPRLMFFAQLDYYKTQKKLLTLEKFVKSKFGVFNDTLYEEFRHYIDNEITETIDEIDSFTVKNGKIKKIKVELSIDDKISTEDKLFLDGVIQKYSKYDIWELTLKIEELTKNLFDKGEVIRIEDLRG